MMSDRAGLEAGAQELHDEPTIVPVANEGRGAVSLGVHEPVTGGLRSDPSAARGGRRDAISPPATVDARGRIAIEHAQRDVRLRAPERPAHGMTMGISNCSPGQPACGVAGGDRCGRSTGARAPRVSRLEC